MRLEWDEVLAHLHPLSPRPDDSRLVELVYRVDEDHGFGVFRFIEVELLIISVAKRLRLRFDGVWSKSGCVYFPEPANAGVLVADLSPRHWEEPIVVVGDDDVREVLFGASRVSAVE